MAICSYTIWKEMKKYIDQEIEKRAIVELTNYLENLIEKITNQTKVELIKLNDYRKIQGIYQKSRIDKYCVQNAIKSINSIENSSYEKKHGGVLKRKKVNEKHSQNKEVLVEVI